MTDDRLGIAPWNKGTPLVNDRGRWLRALTYAQRDYSIIRDNTEKAENLLRQVIAGFVLDDDSGGFGIRSDGALVGLFSRVRGQGDYLVAEAVRHGAWHLNCFDGYLVQLYQRHGFKEVDRVPNWVVGGTDVVYMQQPRTSGYAGGE